VKGEKEYARKGEDSREGGKMGGAHLDTKESRELKRKRNERQYPATMCEKRGEEND